MILPANYLLVCIIYILYDWKTLYPVVIVSQTTIVYLRNCTDKVKVILCSLQCATMSGQ